MKLRIGTLLLGLLFICQTAIADREGPYPVSRVIDGDTVILDIAGKQERVRLIGVDTPETVHPTKPVEHFGREASAFTKRLLKGQHVTLDFDQQRTDRYGRLLAYVYRASDGLFVNQEIVRQGYGHAYTAFPFRYMSQFREAEKEAREAGRGLKLNIKQRSETQRRKEYMVHVHAIGFRIRRLSLQRQRESC